MNGEGWSWKHMTNGIIVAFALVTPVLVLAWMSRALYSKEI